MIQQQRFEMGGLLRLPDEPENRHMIEVGRSSSAITPSCTRSNVTTLVGLSRGISTGPVGLSLVVSRLRSVQCFPRSSAWGFSLAPDRKPVTLNAVGFGFPSLLVLSTKRRRRGESEQLN